MKKSKLGIFAVLSAFAITGVGVGVYSSHAFDNLVDATVNANCALTWDKANAPEIASDGTGTSVAGHTELAYTGAVGVAGNHVGLKAGGTITQSNRAWDGKIGGKVNGLEEITVWYVNNIPTVKTKNPDYDMYDPDNPYNPEYISSSASFYLRTYHNGAMSKSNTKIASGVPIDLRKEKLVANEFILEVSGDASVLTGTIDIQKIEIKCSMAKSYTVSNDSDSSIRQNIVYYEVNADGTLGAPIERISSSYRNFRKNDRFAFKLDEKVTDDIIEAKNVTVTGATLTHSKVEGYDHEVFFVTVGESDVTIVVSKLTSLFPHKGKAYVGKYTLIDAKTLAPVVLEIKEDGTYSFGTYPSGTFTAEGEKVTLVGDNKFVDLTVEADGFTTLTYKTFSDPAYYYGFKGDVATLTKKGVAKNQACGYYGTLTNGTATRDIFSYNKLQIISDDAVTISTVTAPETALTGIFKVVETRPIAIEKADFKLGKVSLDTVETTTATERTITAYFKYRADGVTYENEKLDKRYEGYGTFTCEGKPNLTLDGFGGYFLGTESGATDKYDWQKHIVTIKGVKYKLDLANNTYEELVEIVNFLADGETRNYKSADGLIDVTFTGTKITDNKINASSKYSFDSLSGEITVTIEKIQNYSGVGRNYTFVLGATPDTLTVTRAKKYTLCDTGDWGWQSNDDESDICATMPTTVALQKAAEVVSPFATEKTFSNGTHTFKINKASLIIPKTCKNIESYTVDYTLEGTTLTFTYSFLDPSGDGMYEYRADTRKMIFNQDFTSFSFDSSFTYITTQGYDMSMEFISSSEVFNLVK